jgi:hypothetical protein
MSFFGPYTLKMSSKTFFYSKINLKYIADIFFDLRNDFHANRIYFEGFG